MILGVVDYRGLPGKVPRGGDLIFGLAQILRKISSHNSGFRYEKP